VARGALDRLIAHPGRARLDKCPGQLRRRRQVQVGEQDEPLAQPPQFGSDGLLDLYEDLDVLPDPVRLVDDDGPALT